MERVWPCLIAVLLTVLGCGREATPGDPDATQPTADAGDSGADLADQTADDAHSMLPDLPLWPDAADRDVPPCGDPPPVAPKAPEELIPGDLPVAAFTVVTDSYGFSSGVHAYCTIGADLDGNGREDMLVIESHLSKAQIHVVLLSDGEPQHRFSAIDTALIVPDNGCGAADLDYDGRLDLMLAGTAGLAVYRNLGDGKFVDVSAKYLPWDLDVDAWAVVPGDFDGDGDLDIFVAAGTDSNPTGQRAGCNTQICAYEEQAFACKFTFEPKETPPLQDRLLIRQDTLPFVDKTTDWQLKPGGESPAAAVIDFDGDGKLDMVFGDDFGGHWLMRNRGGWFEYQGVQLGFKAYGHTMGWGIGDFDGDRRWDLLMADLGPAPLYLQQPPAADGKLAFVDQAAPWHLLASTWAVSSWTPVVADLDHDGRDDVFLGTSGIVPKSLFAKWAPCLFDGDLPPQHDLLYLNRGSWFEASRTAALLNPLVMPGVMAQTGLDIDGDGDVDILQVRPEGRVRVLRNDLTKSGDSVVVKVFGKGGNTAAIGTRLVAQIGCKQQRRFIGATAMGGTAFWRAHFGLGGAARIDLLRVLWPDGSKTVIENVAAGSTISVPWP
mgnify:CR=1 FL=1